MRKIFLSAGKTTRAGSLSAIKILMDMSISSSILPNILLDFIHEWG
jgi:hypothetical protein